MTNPPSSYLTIRLDMSEHRAECTVKRHKPTNPLVSTHGVGVSQMFEVIEVITLRRARGKKNHNVNSNN